MLGEWIPFGMSEGDNEDMLVNDLIGMKPGDKIQRLLIICFHLI